MSKKVTRNYRFSEDTIQKLGNLQRFYSKNATEIIENAIKYVHGEQLKKRLNKDYDRVLISQVLGKEGE